MQVGKPPARAKEIKNETCSPAIKIIAGAERLSGEVAQHTLRLPPQEGRLRSRFYQLQAIEIMALLINFHSTTTFTFGLERIILTRSMYVTGL